MNPISFCTGFRGLCAVSLLVAASLGGYAILRASDAVGDSASGSGLDTREVNTTCIAGARPDASGTVALPVVVNQWPGKKASTILTIMIQHPGDPTVWLIGDKNGLLYNYKQGSPFTRLGPAVDLSDRVTELWQGATAWELGLLAAAFHPNFQQNGEIYIYYTAQGPSTAYPITARLSRFKSYDAGATIDPTSEEILTTVDHGTQVHKGAAIRFGRDGYLYIALGDGYISTTAQNLGDLRGKMLRIDVNGGGAFSIPPDNPFVNVSGARPEIFAFGFRNPWRWSFNDQTGEIWLGDVGWNLWEELDVVRRGGNYGWGIREGAHCVGSATCSTAGLIDPIFEYKHTGGASAIIGGYFYTGAALPGLQGRYIFGDSNIQQIWALESDETGALKTRTLGSLPNILTSFAQGQDGELYALSTGRVHRLSAPAGAPQVTIPAKLSETGCVNPQDPTQPAAGLVPYQVNMPLWSDGASKQRWLALPPGGKIHVQDDGDWDLPIGTVLVKSFSLGGKLVETRLFMRHTDGEWGGYSYEWNAEQTEATLLPGEKIKPVGNQKWTFPSRTQCFQCHTAAAGRSLGLETPQLNGLMYYPQTGRTANQLLTLSHLDLFDAPMPAPAGLPAFPDPHDMSKPIDQRARAYVHANCSMCHRPGGPGQGSHDLRYQISGQEMHIYDVAPTQGDFGIAGAKLYAPGSPEHSVISYRTHTLGQGRMPPLATSVVDGLGTTILDDWIRSGLGFGIADSDGDGLADNVDNCPYHKNLDQHDSDGDGHGNACDADLNNDNIVNVLDLSLFKQRFGTHDADADFNGDGVVNVLDLAIFKQLFGKAPGAR